MTASIGVICDIPLRRREPVMRKRVCAAALALMASALPIGLGMTPTLAATTTTWTVTPGGAFSGATGQITLWDSVTNFQMTCTSGKLTGHVHRRLLRDLPRPDDQLTLTMHWPGSPAAHPPWYSPPHLAT